MTPGTAPLLQDVGLQEVGLQDIGRQLNVLCAILSRAQKFRDAGHSLRRTPNAAPGRIFVIGCGDGLFAAEAMTPHAQDLGLDWRASGPLELLLQTHRLHPTDRVIAISMSGNVDRTVEAATAATERGIPMLALVNGSGGRLGQLAATRISLDLADIAPFLCGTSSYTATLAALAVIAEGAADAASTIQAAAGSLAAAQRGALAEAARVVPLVATTPFGGVRLLAAGADIGTVHYGAAKLVELTRLPAWSAELEEFAHSQYWSMPTDNLVVVVVTHPVLAGYASETCRALAALGVATLAIDTAATPVETASWRITVPPVANGLAPLVTALPLQLLAYHLAQAGGLDPNTRRHLKEDTLRFRVSRMLTRRSLLGTGR